MADEPSILNPELMSHFPLIPEIKLKRSVPSLCDSTFIGCNKQTQVTENHWSKKFLVDVTDDGAITLFHLDRSINLSFRFGGSGRYGDSLSPGTMKDPRHPVRKAAHRQRGKGNKRAGKGNKRSGKGKNVSDSKSKRDDAVQTKKDADTTHKDGDGNGGENGNGNEGGSGNGNGGDNGDTDANNGLILHGYTLNINDGHIYDDDKPTFVPSLPARMKETAVQFDGWLSIALAMHMHSLQLNDEYDYDDEVAMDPVNCCPGCITYFGRVEADNFYYFDWLQHEWDAVKLLVTDVFVIRLTI